MSASRAFDTASRRSLPGRRGLGPLSWVGLGLVGMMLLPSIEIAAFVAVAAWIGFAPALLAFLLTSVLGFTLLRSGGPGVLARLAGTLRGGRPQMGAQAGALRDGVWFALGGALMIVPGFVTDVLGFALMLPGLLKGGALVPARPAADPRPADPRFVDLDAAEWQVVSERARTPL